MRMGMIWAIEAEEEGDEVSIGDINDTRVFIRSCM